MSNVSISNNATDSTRDVCVHASTCIHNNVLLFCYDPEGGGHDDVSWSIDY